MLNKNLPSENIVPTFIAITSSYFIILLISHYFYLFNPELLFFAQRTSFIAIAFFFTKVFDYSIFNNRKIDFSFSALVLIALLCSLFVDKVMAAQIDVLFLAPLTEEFFFRGFMIGLIFERAIIEKNVLVRTTAIVGSIVVSLCGFVLMHPPKDFLYALHFGFLLSVIMIAYRSLWFSKISNYAVIFPMIPHFFNNLFKLSNIFDNNILGNFAILLIILVLMIFWSIILYKNIKTKFPCDY